MKISFIIENALPVYKTLLEEAQLPVPSNIKRSLIEEVCKVLNGGELKSYRQLVNILFKIIHLQRLDREDWGYGY